MKKELYKKMVSEVEKIYPEFNPSLRVGVPVPILIQEAENLFHWCQPDKAALKQAGLDWKLVQDIPKRIKFVQELEAQWFIARKTKSTSKKIYLDALQQCRALCAQLVRDFRYALSDVKDAMEYLAKYNRYRKTEKVGQDLRSLALLGKKQAASLSKINFDLALLDKAKAMGKGLQIKDSSTVIDIERAQLKSLYVKACIHLKEAVTEVRRCGRYVFHGNKARLVGYRSEYRRLHKTKA